MASKQLKILKFLIMVYVGYTVGNAVIPSRLAPDGITYVSNSISNIYLSEPQNTVPIKMNLQSHVPWQDGKSLTDAAAHLYMKPTLSDVKFTFSKEKTATPVPAHKFILAMRSSEFENMFYDSSSSPSAVDITEIKREMFLQFLKFLYTDKVDLNNSNVSSVLYISYKYQVTKLANLCQKHLLNNVSPRSACTILGISGNYKLASLQTKCLAFIEENTSEILQTDDWLSLNIENLQLVLSRDELSAPEKEIFEAVMKWASGECKRQGLHDIGTNRRYVLGDALYQIRIPTMSMEEYSQVAVKSGVLTDTEQLAIFKHLASGSVEPVQNFVTKPRKGKQIIIEFNTLKDTYDPDGYALEQSLDIGYNSSKTMKSMVINLDNTKPECQQYRGGFGYPPNRLFGYVVNVDCFVLQVNSNKDSREIKITKSKGSITVDITPPMILSTASDYTPPQSPLTSSSNLSMLKYKWSNHVQISVWKNNCSNCGAERCQQIGNNVNGREQNKDISVTSSGLDLAKSITFS